MNVFDSIPNNSLTTGKSIKIDFIKKWWSHERNTKNRSNPPNNTGRTGKRKSRDVSAHQTETRRVRTTQSRKEIRGFIDRRL